MPDAFTIFGISLILLMAATPVVIWRFSPDRKRLARQVAALLADGRPRGCKCPPNPGMNALPSDNRHISSPRCPMTQPAPPDEIAELRSQVTGLQQQVADLALALQVLAPPQPSGPWTGAHAAGPS